MPRKYRRRRQKKTVGTRLKRLEYKVNVQQKPEAKYFNVRQAPQVTYAGSLSELNGIVNQGDEDIQRNGDAIFMKNMLIHCSIMQQGSGNQDIVRIILFYDKENKVASVSDFWDGTYLGITNAPQGFKNHDKRFQTNVLLDRIFTINNNAQSIKHFTKNLKINKRVQYDAGSNTIQTGSLKLFMITSNPGTTNPDIPKIDFTARCNFLDP